jgi:2-keto-4-pentenoate hydratase/2-oxohepta-3-ene-1,7-dioic acid hydratase in catechol pathway
MKLARFGERGLERPAAVDGNGILRDLSSIVDDVSPMTLANRLPALGKLRLEGLPAAPTGCRLGQPVAQVGKIVCVGLNYTDHAHETGQAVPAEPILFLKATSALCGPNDDLVLPIGSSKVDWEVELAVVIGQEARNISLQRARDFIAGVAVMHDVSERAFQLERGGQWDKGKGCDTFGPLGPHLVTLDEAGDLANMRLWCDVNGHRMQDGNTRTMIFDVPFLVHYVSSFMSLQPGDVISTGTPPGVGMAQKPPQWLKAGDTVELGIDGLGSQRQRVVSAAPETASR